MERQQITRTEPRVSRAPDRPTSGSGSAASAHPIVALQRRVGNQAAARIVQAKLRVGPPGDVYEQEADRVADDVMRMPEGGPVAGVQRQAIRAVQARCADCEREERETARTLQRAPARSMEVLRRCACGGTCASCRGEEEGGPLQREEAGAGAGSGFAPPAVHSVLASAGRPLGPGTRAFMEDRLGADFGGVRVHTDAPAAQSAREVDAHAYTVGNDVVFGAGRYAPGTREGDRLIAHELTHVLQQAGAPHRLQRQRGGGCAIELCFLPIGMGGLGRAGLLHGVLNLRDGSGRTHLEVDPARHMGEGPAGVPRPHSHVVGSAGWRSRGTCQTIPATCAQVAAVRRAGSEYEDLDVTYGAPPGPNSNSFPEWALDRAGISTSGIAVPAGALGWGYYMSNPAERTSPPRATHRMDQMRCRGTVRPARTFRALIDLVRDVETRMIACGVTSVQERIHQLRGIYYGTIWSMDYSAERSGVRNFFFQQYTGSSTPADPRACIPCELFQSLARSQDVRERGRSIDFGHLMIGLDARRSAVARTSVRAIEGVTGLEASTWVGDLGGAAARVALDRASGILARRAAHYFRGTDYGGSINLEGDVAGYLVASGGVTAGVAPPLAVPAGGTVADALQAYLFPAAGSTTGWNSRCASFLQVMGGTLSGTTLTNRGVVLASMADRIHNFACSYLANFLRQRGRANPALCLNAARHLEGASREVGEVFIAALEHCASHPGAPLQARGAGPAPSPIGSASMRCTVTCGALRVAGPLGGALNSAGQQAEELLEQGRRVGGGLLREGRETWDRIRGELPF